MGVRASVDGTHPLLEWYRAFAGLRDNPLAKYLLISTYRRSRRDRQRRRILYCVLVFAPATVALISLLVREGVGGFMNAIGDLLPIVMVVLILGLVIAWITWFGFTLFAVASGCLALLSGARSTAGDQALEESAAVTALSDREVVAAALRVYLPPLFWVALTGSLLYLPVSVQLSLDLRGVTFAWANFTTWFYYLPVTVLWLLVSGVLGAAALILLTLALGRGVGAPAARLVGAFFLLLAQLVYTFAAVVWQASNYHRYNPFQSYIFMAPDPLKSALGTACGLTLLWLLLLLAARRSRVWRTLLAADWPLLYPLVAAAVVGSLALAKHPLYFSFANWSFFGTYHWAWGAFAVVNPLALPHPGCLGLGLEDLQRPALLLLEWFRYPLLLATQCTLVAMLLHFARDAVRLRRQSAEG